MGTLPRTWIYEKQIPEGAQYIVSVSTKLATFPSSSIPRALNRVPALLHDNLEMSVIEEGNPERAVRIGAEEEGTVIVRANPRIADVRMPEASKPSFSRGESRDLKSTKGWIMYEFQRKPASRLSIDTVAASVDLQSDVSHVLHFQPTYAHLSCNRRVKSKSEL
jgi:hypothetical protein